MNHLRTLPPPARPPAQPRIERTVDVLVVMSACTLETLPIFSWLLLLAAYDTGDPNTVVVPFWWMWLLLFAVCWLGTFFARGGDNHPDHRRRNTLLLTLAITVLGPLSLVVTYLLSPAVQAFLAGGSDASAAVALALLVTWLWIRGLTLGRRRIIRERLYRIFLIALGVTIAALAGAAAVQNAARGLTASYLALLLALLLFAGPMGLTLAQARDATHEMRANTADGAAVRVQPVFTRSWLAASLGLSLGLALLALLLATVFSRQSVSIFAVAAGNVFGGLLAAVIWLLTPVFFLLYLILNKPIEWLAQLFHGLKRPQPLTVPTPPPNCGPTPGSTPGSLPSTPPKPCLPPVHAPTPPPIPLEWLTALRWGLITLAIVVVLVVLARALYRYTDQRHERAYSDERTMLDAREILGAQLRRFFDAFRRQPNVDEPATADLAVGSVRHVYRDVLVAAAGSGRTRREAETPEEFQRRLTHGDPAQPETVPAAEVADAFERLTHTYEQARYGPPDADGEQPAASETVTAADAVRRWLARDSRG